MPESDWEAKVWGKTRCEVESEFYSKHRLVIEPGTYCSWHYHQQRANRFVVEKGIVEVAVLMGPKLITSIITEDQTFDVPSLVVHQFRCHERSLVIEEYWPDRGGKVENSDIVRLMQGGKLGEDGCPDSFDGLLAIL